MAGLVPGGRHGGRGSYQHQQTFFGNVDVTDPTHAFISDEYNELLQSNHWPAVLAMRDAPNRNNGFQQAVQQGGQQGGGGHPHQIAGVGTEDQNNGSNQQQQQQQQQPIPDRGSQNGSGFGSGAYRNN